MQIKVNGIFYDFANDVSINTTLATLASTFTFTAKFDINNPDHKNLFRPLQYPTVEFYDDPTDKFAKPRLLSTGTLVEYSFNSQASPDLVQLSGYSLPGVLEDCQIPRSLYPLESSGVSLKHIAERLIKPFGLKLVVYDSVAKECNESIAKTAATPEMTIKDYICKIANQKNVVVSHDIHGNLIMFRPVITTKSKLFIQPNDGSCVSMTLNVNGRGIHSDLSSLRQPERGNGSNPFDNDYAGLDDDSGLDDLTNDTKSFKIGSESTIKNPLVKVFRPSVDVLTSGTFYNTLTAAKNRRAAELQNIRIDFTLDYWPAISVGDVIEVYNPEIFIFERTRMVLDSTTISESSDKKIMTGSLVLPETFTGDEPKTIFG